MGVRRVLPVFALSAILLVSSFTINSVYSTSDGTVISQQKISDLEGDFGGVLDDADFFGPSVANLGDLDGDGVNDLAVGAGSDDDGGVNRGAVYILFMNMDGTVKSEQKISDLEGNFNGVLDNEDFFGNSLASIGDLDNDGVNDLAVGAPIDDDGGGARGAVYILFLNSDGTVKSEQKISDIEGNFGGILDNNNRFGNSIDKIGDLDGDGIVDLAVGSNFDDDGGTSFTGAVWILFMKTDGTVKSEQKISKTQGDFGVLATRSGFGNSVTGIGDLDEDGIEDIAVGASRVEDGDGPSTGAVWILFLGTDGKVDGSQKISSTSGGLVGTLEGNDQFGTSLANMGDLDGDGVTDLAVGARGDDDGTNFSGAIYVLFMNTNGTVKEEQKISNTEGNFGGVIDGGDVFGSSVANLGDLDGNGENDLAVGTPSDDDGGFGRGAVWILFLNSLNSPPDCSEVIPNSEADISSFDNAIVVTSNGSPTIVNIETSPSHKTVEIGLSGVTDPDGDTTTLTVDAITQDEPTSGSGKGDKSPDGFGVGTETASIRAERLGTGDGRVYEISFTAEDGNGGMCSGSVFVAVPHDNKKDPIDSGQNFDSTLP